MAGNPDKIPWEERDAVFLFHIYPLLSFNLTMKSSVHLYGFIFLSSTSVSVKRFALRINEELLHISLIKMSDRMIETY